MEKCTHNIINNGFNYACTCIQVNKLDSQVGYQILRHQNYDKISVGWALDKHITNTLHTAHLIAESASARMYVDYPYHDLTLHVMSIIDIYGVDSVNVDTAGQLGLYSTVPTVTIYIYM